MKFFILLHCFYLTKLYIYVILPSTKQQKENKMTKLEEARQAIILERLEDTNKVLSVLNDTFIKYELDTSKYNNTTIKAVMQGSRRELYYVVVNGNLLQIINPAKVYNYEINGSSGKNTKFIKELELPFGINTTITISEAIKD